MTREKEMTTLWGAKSSKSNMGKGKTLKLPEVSLSLFEKSMEERGRQLKDSVYTTAFDRDCLSQVIG